MRCVSEQRVVHATWPLCSAICARKRTNVRIFFSGWKQMIGKHANATRLMSVWIKPFRRQFRKTTVARYTCTRLLRTTVGRESRTIINTYLTCARTNENRCTVRLHCIYANVTNLSLHLNCLYTYDITNRVSNRKLLFCRCWLSVVDALRLNQRNGSERFNSSLHLPNDLLSVFVFTYYIKRADCKFVSLL